MARWEQRSVRVYGKYGEKTITYKAQGIDAWVESRRRAIPHANGMGTWNHTTYFVCRPDGSEKEYYTLKDAKEAAEMISGER